MQIRFKCRGLHVFVRCADGDGVTRIVRPQLGFTLVETLVVVCLLALLLGLAIPSYQGFQERYRLEGHAQELTTDLYYLRSEAVARNKGLRISFGSDAGGTCYVLHSGSAGDCSCASDGISQCTAADATVIKSLGLRNDRGVRIQPNVTSMLFDPVRGTTTPTGTVNITTASGKALRQIVNIMGRTKICSPNASVRGYEAC